MMLSNKYVKQIFYSKDRFSNETGSSIWYNATHNKNIRLKPGEQKTYGSHRRNGPARIHFESEAYEWIRKGIYHKVDGPAYIEKKYNIIRWYFNGKVIVEETYWNK